MFEKRNDLIKFLAVAETGAILSAADKLGITQPALSRVVARLERQFGGRLFDRMSTGVRLTPLGAVAADLARHILYEIEVAEEKIGATHLRPHRQPAGHGRARVDAAPCLPDVIAKFHETCPGVELKLKTTSPVRGGPPPGQTATVTSTAAESTAPSPCRSSCKSERFLDMTWGSRRTQGPSAPCGGTVSDEALADYPWIDFDAHPCGPTPPTGGRG